MTRQILYRNMTNRRSLLRLLTVPLAVVLLSMLGGCGFVSEDMPECKDSAADISDKVMLRFNMESGSIVYATRADNQNHEEVDSEMPAFENAVNIRDLGLYIFFGNDDIAPLIAKTTSIADSSDPYNMITGSNGFYTITMSVERDEIEERLGDADNAYLRILVLANCYSPGAAGGNLNSLTANLRTSTAEASTFKEVVDQAQTWGFDMSELYEGNEGDSYASGLWKGMMPMFGTNTFNVSRESLLRSTMGEQIYLGEVNLLRSLAKVRVIDNIETKVNGLPRIEEVNIYSQTDMAYSLPYNATTYIDGQQVHENYHIHSSTDNNYGSYEYKLGYLNSDKVVRIGYIPEQAIGTELPSFAITVTFSLDAAGKPAKQETYIVPMTGYDGYQNPQPFEFGDNILRNHIYTLQVNDARTGFPADITIHVSDWDEQTFTLDYSENLLVGDRIAVTGGAAYSNIQQGFALMQPWHDELPVPMTCTFGIQSPMGATWTASFITTAGSQGSFAFLSTDVYGDYLKDEKGNYVMSETISGTVDGNLSTLHIVSTDPAPTQQNVAYLQVVMELNGKYSVVQIWTPTADHDYFRIIQNPLE